MVQGDPISRHQAGVIGDFPTGYPSRLFRGSLRNSVTEIRTYRAISWCWQHAAEPSNAERCIVALPSRGLAVMRVAILRGRRAIMIAVPAILPILRRSAFR
jgi:hypothetical protein